LPSKRLRVDKFIRKTITKLRYTDVLFL